MKNINVTLEDRDHKKLVVAKCGMTWREYILKDVD